MACITSAISCCYTGSHSRPHAVLPKFSGYIAWSEGPSLQCKLNWGQWVVYLWLGAMACSARPVQLSGKPPLSCQVTCCKDKFGSVQGCTLDTKSICSSWIRKQQLLHTLSGSNHAKGCRVFRVDAPLWGRALALPGSVP